MELASMLAGDRFFDHPRSASPVIAAFLRAYNDWIDDECRQDLYRFAAAVVGTRASSEVEEIRLRACEEWCRMQQTALRSRWSRLRARIGLPVAGRRSQAPATTAGWLSARRVAAGHAGVHEAAQAFVERLIACTEPPSRVTNETAVASPRMSTHDTEGRGDDELGRNALRARAGARAW
jgi:hypothetical protein